MENNVPEIVPNFKYASRILAAKAMAESVHYLSNRDFLSDLGKLKTFSLTVKENIDYKSEIIWIKLSQIGLHETRTVHEHFSSFQKLLYSCHDPKCKQFVFVVNGDGKKISLYLGVRFFELDNDADSFMDGMASFVQNLYPGSIAEIVMNIDDEISLKNNLKSRKLHTLNSITGIPSFVKAGEEHFSSIDTIVGTLNKTNFCYMVIADPIAEDEIQTIITQCNEMSGQMESVKSYNYSEALNSNKSVSYTETESRYSNWSKSEGTSKKNNAGQLLFGGLTLAAAAMFLPSVSLLPVAAKQLATNKNFGFGFMTASGILSGFVPQNTSTETKGGGISHGTSKTEGFSQGQAETLSLTIVNKHAESIASKLNLHTKRFEQGLGQGMWKVSSYILTENPTIANTVSLQLKSIISGEKSSLEPIRIHDLSYLLNSQNNYEVITQCLSRASHPKLAVSYTTVDNELKELYNPFENANAHLCTILTTEELSCMINLPQKSVPGISVIESLPNFCMNSQSINPNTATINIGNSLYNGTESNIPIKLPVDVLSRHSIVAGVNGSGKTNTVLGIIEGLHKLGRPFFVIEPAKTEYVDWAIEYNKSINDPHKKIKIFMPGCEFYAKANIKPDKLRINPFEVIALPNSEMRVLSHIDRLKSIFASGFPMQDILPVIIEHLLYDLYTNVHQMIDKEDYTNYMKKGVPTLKDINRDYIKDFMEEIGYAEENTQNISAALTQV